MSIRILNALLLATLSLTACNSSKHGNKTGAEAGENMLEDQIMVDPNLGRKAPAGAGRLLHAPAPRSAGSRETVTLGQLAREQAGGSQTNPGSGCDRKFKYDLKWANKLPAAFPLYDGAKLTEAAGNDTEPCRMRLVSFTSSAPLQHLIDFYYTRAINDGFNAEHQRVDGEDILAGARTKDDGAYYLAFNARKDGITEVDMIVNHGVK